MERIVNYMDEERQRTTITSIMCVLYQYIYLYIHIDIYIYIYYFGLCRYGMSPRWQKHHIAIPSSFPRAAHFNLARSIKVTAVVSEATPRSDFEKLFALGGGVWSAGGGGGGVGPSLALLLCFLLLPRKEHFAAGRDLAEARALPEDAELGPCNGSPPFEGEEEQPASLLDVDPGLTAPN